MKSKLFIFDNGVQSVGQIWITWLEKYLIGNLTWKKIDFVVLWVDGNDPEFIREKNKYTPHNKKIDNDEDNVHRYRDYGTFNYWFRMVERHAPWVNNIYLITNGQRPKWLNCKSS